MAIFIIDKEAKERIQYVKKYAEANPYCYEEMALMSCGRRKVPREEVERFEMRIAKSWRFIYLIEEQKVNDGFAKFRHLSGFNTETLKPPHVLIVKEMMTELGFKNPIEKCKIFFSENNMIVHIMEEFE
jgi:hypothetical protein